MKKEYILYYFDKVFKGKADPEAFEQAKNSLFNVVVSKDSDFAITNLRKFAVSYYSICREIKRNLNQNIEIANSKYSKKTNLLTKLKLKKELKSLHNFNMDACKFYNTFYKAFGVHLADIKQSAEIEKIIEDRKNGVW